MKYAVLRAEKRPAVDGIWDQEPWRGVEALRIGNHMGTRPEHLPRAEAKLVYDAEAVYAIFRVEDRYVRATAGAHQQRVCTDSCVEFFFTPGPDVSKGYFNLEMNCGGTALFHFQVIPRKDPVNVSESDLRQMEIAHTLPEIVEPERAEPTTWSVAYRLPMAILWNYVEAVRPAPGVVWRANFFKCGDKTSHPHWLTWAPVGRPKPEFHVPGDFGVLEFA